MPIDATGISIAAAVAGVIAYAIAAMMLRKDIEILSLAIVFIAVFGIFGSLHAVYVAIKGDPESLPSIWREYLAMAAIIIGVPLMQHLANVIKKLFSSPQDTSSPR